MIVSNPAKPHSLNHQLVSQPRTLIEDEQVAIGAGFQREERVQQIGRHLLIRQLSAARKRALRNANTRCEISSAFWQVVGDEMKVRNHKLSTKLDEIRISAHRREN